MSIRVEKWMQNGMTLLTLCYILLLNIFVFCLQLLVNQPPKSWSELINCSIHMRKVPLVWLSKCHPFELMIKSCCYFNTWYSVLPRLQEAPGYWKLYWSSIWILDLNEETWKKILHSLYRIHTNNFKLRAYCWKEYVIKFGSWSLLLMNW